MGNITVQVNIRHVKKTAWSSEPSVYEPPAASEKMCNS